MQAARSQLPTVKSACAGQTPRQRQALRCLLEGDGEKQAAQRLGLSRNTVHAYVKQLHTRFGVRSRGELLSKCQLPLV